MAKPRTRASARPDAAPRGRSAAARTRKLEHDLDALYESLHYREFKILLKAEDFDPNDIEAEVHDYWKLTRRVATQLLIHVSRSKTETDPVIRDVAFLDTPGFDLYRRGYMLRVRRPYQGTQPGRRYELTLKFRGADIARAAAVDLEAAKGLAGRTKFKEELLLVSAKLGGMRSIFSHTCQIKDLERPLGRTLSDYTRIFPHLGTLGLRATARIADVTKVPVQEVLYELGELGFRGTKTAKVDMAVWRNAKTHEVLIGEFAYETHFRHYGRLHPIPKLRSERLYRILQRETGAWVELGNTKTSLYYGLSGKKVAHDE
ncbi:hypothetical protein MYXO_00485 [Myxococcaceae bacterium]|nr:hypothetical protein MYXO_00485 [Myxococcaceae bacterium]